MCTYDKVMIMFSNSGKIDCHTGYAESSVKFV